MRSSDCPAEQEKNYSKVGNVFKVNNKDTRTMPLASSGVFVVNFEHISHLVLVFLLLNLSR